MAGRPAEGVRRRGTIGGGPALALIPMSVLAFTATPRGGGVEPGLGAGGGRELPVVAVAVGAAAIIRLRVVARSPMIAGSMLGGSEDGGGPSGGASVMWMSLVACGSVGSVFAGGAFSASPPF